MTKTVQGTGHKLACTSTISHLLGKEEKIFSLEDKYHKLSRTKNN